MGVISFLFSASQAYFMLSKQNGNFEDDFHIFFFFSYEIEKQAFLVIFTVLLPQMFAVLILKKRLVEISNNNLQRKETEGCVSL